MKDLPEDLPLDVNPREPKMNTNVAKRLKNAVVEPEMDFYINNRGIVIAAKSLVFNSSSSEVTYPIFGAFRSLLKYDDHENVVKWLFDPIEIWSEIGVSLVQNTFETYKNPQLAGKDKQLWLSNYRIVETQSLRMQLKQNR